MYHPSLAEVKQLRQYGNLVPVYREVPVGRETPLTAFLKINRCGNSFLLENLVTGQPQSRYSYVGTDPYKLLISRGGDAADPLSNIARELGKYKFIPVAGLPVFTGGVVGYLAYEAVTRFEEVPVPDGDSLSLPESLFLLTDTMLIFDHTAGIIKVIGHVRLDTDIDASYAEAKAKIDALIVRLHQPCPPVPPAFKTAFSTDCGEFSSNFSESDFIAGVLKIKEYITAGEAIQVVLSRRLIRQTCASPFAIYRALRSLNPSPYMFLFDFNDFQVIGASPEMLVRVTNGAVMTRPLAGTRPRGDNPVADASLADELRGDAKERAEHIMLVDLGRNDIGRVSELGTVRVSELMAIERYSHVMHLVTHVQGKLRRDLNALDALRACFPAGTVSGAPKIRAMQIIAGLEPEKRGPYAGAVGYLSFSGDMDMAITIRTIVMIGSTACIQSGAGIVYDSVPEREYQETLHKALVLLTAIAQAENESEIREHVVADR